MDNSQWSGPMDHHRAGTIGWWIILSIAVTLTWWCCVSVCCAGTSGSDTAVLLEFLNTVDQNEFLFIQNEHDVATWQQYIVTVKTKDLHCLRMAAALYGV